MRARRLFCPARALWSLLAPRRGRWRAPVALTPAVWRIVELTSQNASLLGRVAPDVFDYEIKPAQLENFLDDPRHIMMMALGGSMVVGVASAVEYFHPDKSPQLWINEVGVSPAWRGRGVGRSLVAEMVQAAARRGCRYAWVSVEGDNRAARACIEAAPHVERPQPFLLYEWDLAE